MRLQKIKLKGFKSFGSEIEFEFPTNVTGIVGPNGSGKSNITEAFRFVLGEQSMKTLRGKKGIDLIFNGGNSTNRSKSALVELFLNNKDNFFDVDYDVLKVGRELLEDGTSVYRINDSDVRHKDIIELLAKANIGATGHHIISQGEADRILNAKNTERKEILEDGLGLKLAQYKKNDTKRQIIKTRINLDKILGMEREVAPHLKYLKKQIEKNERRVELEKELKALYKRYLAIEDLYIKNTNKHSNANLDALEKKVFELNNEIENVKIEKSQNKKIEKLRLENTNLRTKLYVIKEEKEDLTRKLGRLEGEMSALKIMNLGDEASMVDKKTLEEIYNDFNSQKPTADDFKKLFNELLDKLLEVLKSEHENNNNRLNEIGVLMNKINLEKDELVKAEKLIYQKQSDINIEINKILESAQNFESEIIDKINERNKYEQEISSIKYNLNTLALDLENLENEIKEGAVLVGQTINEYKFFELSLNDKTEDRDKQKLRRKNLERLKIQLETIGVVDEEIVKEYERIIERKEIIEREKEDINKSLLDLEIIIEGLQKEINEKFKTGIKKINEEFDALFKTLFGGGSAMLILVKDEKDQIEGEGELEYGIDIKISLKHKKISYLNQLSGGERALVSISLLFAISQVTPPPFLILDETDAALDESNSKRYGDMIDVLSKKSQLILVTHNRETMYRAGSLYGITMKNGHSVTLSVNFEEAIKVAK